MTMAKMNRPPKLESKGFQSLSLGLELVSSLLAEKSTFILCFCFSQFFMKTFTLSSTLNMSGAGGKSFCVRGFLKTYLRLRIGVTL